MGVSSSESHDLTAFYEMLSASFGVLSQNTGFYPYLDRIIETTLGPLNLGPGGGSYNEPISHLHQMSGAVECHSILSQQPEWDHGPCQLWLQGLSVVTGIEQKVDHLNPALWKGDVQVSGVQLMLAWKSGQYQIESDAELAEFKTCREIPYA